ncbi:hypothetical protein H696_03159 [Fonticula alba]|uniref:Cyclin-like domain-containing protein n=1 Tax=Fonticula alba TaxID=691883 RepID=A0A058ZA42_FONAL|nr:hypothetical protein H696_03159 [Fonticula alba]KCV70808.1 hypothetical protein H696_03159 [Fonticula alba]|eukprot:XP_009495324.1 hypothetical protein H696_03159 [Fonticula alba]
MHDRSPQSAPPAPNLFLGNVILPDSILAASPSTKEGLSPELEYDLRVWTCDFVWELGIALTLPQNVISTAQVLLQRYYYQVSFSRSPAGPTALAAVFLASKLCERPRHHRDAIFVYHYLAWRAQQGSAPQSRAVIAQPTEADLKTARQKERQRLEGDNPLDATPTSDRMRTGLASSAGGDASAPSLPLDAGYSPLVSFSDEYTRLENILFTMEKVIIRALGFHLHVELPHASLLIYANVLGLHDLHHRTDESTNDADEADEADEATAPAPASPSSRSSLSPYLKSLPPAIRERLLDSDYHLIQRAWNFCNDALVTNLLVKYEPVVVTCAAVDLACRVAGRPLPLGWNALFGCSDGVALDTGGRCWPDECPCDGPTLDQGEHADHGSELRPKRHRDAALSLVDQIAREIVAPYIRRRVIAGAPDPTGATNYGPAGLAGNPKYHFILFETEGLRPDVFLSAHELGDQPPEATAIERQSPMGNQQPAPIMGRAPSLSGPGSSATPASRDGPPGPEAGSGAARQQAAQSDSPDEVERQRRIAATRAEAAQILSSLGRK